MTSVLNEKLIQVVCVYKKMKIKSWLNHIETHLWSSESSIPINSLDLVFKCSDGIVFAHKIILITACPLIAKAVEQGNLSNEELVQVTHLFN